MSPASSKSKSKDKRAAGKESNKATAKSSSNGNAVGASGYNPLLGTFHTLETAPVSSVPSLYVNGRFRNIDETDDHAGTGVDYDAVSNNDSLSGESEEHRDKTTSHLPLRQNDIIPGADYDKREKIRQKNEKKHQRQKERRAQELHERCSGYLMSRKLEALAQQLVTMGFSSERATMALILNEGKLEESVSWLFEGGEESEEQKEQQQQHSGNLKIDISEELARIAEMEIKFKCSKMDIERAIVACEGDLEKAAESLRVVQKPEPPLSSTPKPEENGDPPTSAHKTTSSVATNQNSSSISSSLSRQQQAKPSSYMSNMGGIQQKREEKDFNYAKVAVTAESGSKNMQAAPKKILQPPKSTDLVKPQNVAASSDKRWPVAGSCPVNYSLPSPLQAPFKIENRYVSVGTELKNLQLGSVKEPVIMMQRSQSMHTTRPAVSTTSNSSLEAMKPNGLGPQIPPPPPPTSSKNLGPINTSSSNHQLYNQLHYQQQYHQLDPAGTSSSSRVVNSSSWNRSGTSPPLAAASSLGLFSGLGSNGSSGSSSPVDWNNGGSMLHLDYSNIDWSLDRGLTGSRTGGMMWHHNQQQQQEGINVNSFMLSNGQPFESYSSSAVQGMRVKSSTTMRPILTDGVSNEWTSPFEEKDIFSVPRQFVSSPSL